MRQRNLDFQIPLLREQWQQLGESANLRPDFGVLRWAPAEFDVIRVSVREDDRPAGWAGVVPPVDDLAPEDREVAVFVYNDGRPFARLTPPAQPAPPGITAAEDAALDAALERWVRDKWHELMRDSGIHYDRAALPMEEPNPPR